LLRLAVERALFEPSIRARARELAEWAAAHDAGARAAGLIERACGADAQVAERRIPAAEQPS